MTSYGAILDGSRDVWGIRIPDLERCYGGGDSPEAALAVINAAGLDRAFFGGTFNSCARSLRHRHSRNKPPISGLRKSATLSSTSSRLTRGARKVRWTRQGSGKRGGVRVIYFHLVGDELLLLVMVYAKAVLTNVKPKDIKRS